MRTDADSRIALPDRQGDGRWGWQRIILLMIILQSIGIRALPMQGVLISALVCLVLAPRIGIPLKQFLSLVFLSAGFIALATRAMSSHIGAIYLALVLVQAFFYVRYLEKRWATLESDLLTVAWWLTLHGLASYLVYLVLPSAFTVASVGGASGMSGMKYRYLGFFVLSGASPGRVTGLCWEPGLFQYVANLALFLGVKHRWPRWRLAACFMAVVLTHSTTGIFVLVPTLVYLLMFRRRSPLQWVAIGCTAAVVGAMCVGIFEANIADKLGGENTSGLVRLRDLQVGWELIKEKPLLGHGQFDEKYLLAKSNIYAIATEFFSKEFLASSGELGGGYTNGFLGFVASYGVLVGFFGYWCFYRNRLIQGGRKERVTFFLISILTFVSEPITSTSWFYFLAISGLCSTGVAGRLAATHTALLAPAREAKPL